VAGGAGAAVELVQQAGLPKAGIAAHGEGAAPARRHGGQRAIDLVELEVAPDEDGRCCCLHGA
jgi:hypothetical protein